MSLIWVLGDSYLGRIVDTTQIRGRKEVKGCCGGRTAANEIADAERERQRELARENAGLKEMGEGVADEVHYLAVGFGGALAAGTVGPEGEVEGDALIDEVDVAVGAWQGCVP